MKKLRLLICLLLLGAGLSGCGRQASEQPPRETVWDLSEGFLPASESDTLTRIHENGRFVLYANLSSGEAAVEDKAQGYTWYSNPVDKREDALAGGFHKNALLSVITVEYSTSQNVNMTCGGYMSSVAKDGLSYRLEEDGSVIFLFDFPNEEFRIPLRYAVEEERFVAQVLTEGITEYGTNQIVSIDILPFFGAGGKEQEGYMLVPDGSGALIYYNNNRLTANTYSKELYGFDDGTNDKNTGPAAAVPSRQTQAQAQYLPVFGVHQEDYGFLAVITGGDGRTSIKANVAGKYTSFNTVWGSYKYRTIGTVRQIQKDGTDKAAGVGEKQLELWEDYEVSFFFLDRGKSDYEDMASFYREYLKQHEGLERRINAGEQIPIYLDLYGYMIKNKSFMGIPMDRKITLTDVSEANGMLDALSARGVGPVVVKYNYWMKDSYWRKIPTSAKEESRVAHRKELLQLQQRLEDGGGGLYLSADLLNIYQPGNGVSKVKDFLQSAVNTAQNQYRFLLESTGTDSRYKSWNLLRPASIEKFYQKLVHNMQKAGYHNLALDAIGEKCYSELGSGGMGRNQVTEVLRDTVSCVSQTMEDVMLTGANGYAAVWAGHILRSPGGASGYDIEDVSVPFYQMVMHGYVSYSLDAVNLCGNPEEMTLKCMEYGAYPMYSLAGENIDELIGSSMDHLYSADFSNWEEYIAFQYRQLNQVLAQVQDSVIIGHEIPEGNLRKVSYENGTVIYVNYGQNDLEADGFLVRGKGYTSVRSGVVLAQGTAAEGEGGGY